MQPQQDKFVKDRLLNQIFQEIADENSETSETADQKEKNSSYSKKLTRKKLRQRIRQRVIIALLVILIIFVLFTPHEEKNHTDVMNDKNSIYSIPKANQIPVETEEAKILAETKEVLVKEEPLIKITESAPVVDTKNNPEVTIEESKPLMPEEPKTAREKAKNILMQQMQN